MARTANEERRRLKLETILESACAVFCCKGFANVTMKDIIDECGISRGGIYLYYPSVEEVFIAAAKYHTKRKYDGICRLVREDVAFGELLDSYFAMQKERFLHMENSILLATYEYFFTHRTPEDKTFQQSLVSSLHDTIAEILNLGVRQGVLEDDGLPELTQNFLFVFEGMSVLALLCGISEELIDRQFALMRAQLPLKGRTPPVGIRSN